MLENTGNSRIAAEATFSLRVIIYYLLSLVQSPSSDQTRIRSLFIFLFIYLLIILITHSVGSGQKAK